MKASLPPALYDRLTAASKGWSLPLFGRDPETGAYEYLHSIADDGQDEDLELLDAACLAAEILTESGLDFEGDPAIAPFGDEGGTVSLEYHFGADEEPLAYAFRRRLEDLAAADAGISWDFQKYPVGFLANVRLRFRHDEEYQRKKDAVDWALQLARAEVSGRPFLGRRL